MKPVRWIAIGVGIALIVGLFLILRPSEDESPPSASPSASPSVAASPTEEPTANPTASPTEEPSPTPEVVEIEIEVEDGRVDGPSAAEVTQGATVRIVVRADVSDEVHLHGYDLKADVTPDEPGVVEFVADAPGVYEVELEDAGLLLLELTVSP